jgi:CBS domain-containing protein
MEIELVEIRDFLASHPPFDHLPAAALDKLPKALTVRYLRRGTPFPPKDADQDYLYVIRQGAVEMRNAAGDLASKLGEGDMCTFPCQKAGGEAPFEGNTLEDTLAYLLPCDELFRLKAEHADDHEHRRPSLGQGDQRRAPRLHPGGGAHHERRAGILDPDHGRR